METEKEKALRFWRIVGLVVVSVVVLANLNLTITQTMVFHGQNVWKSFLFPALLALFQQNQFVQVVLFGSISAYMYMVFNMLYRTVILPFFVGMQCSIVVHNTDPSFTAVIDFISDHLLSEIQGAQYSLQANTKSKESRTRKEWIQEWLRGDNVKPNEFIYRPDNDQVIHTLHYKGVPIFLERSKQQAMMGRDQPFTPESLKLTIWGSDNSILKELLCEALVAANEQKREGLISIFTLSSGWLSGWELALTKKARGKDSVILDMEDMDTLLNDARNFLQSGKWYTEMGIPYRRGYLLYGPPGCGKTSFAQVLAGEMKLDLCILNLTHAGLTDDQLAENLRDAPINSIIVLEDVDAIFVERSANKESTSSEGGGRRGGGSGTSVSFSGLLNALDGVASQEGRLLFMTTNHREKLDPALIRPGRCDVQLEVKLASKNQMERMFLRFFPGETEKAKQFAYNLPANEVSMAALQGYFLKCLDCPQKCVDHTNELLQDARPLPPKVKTVQDHLERMGLERYAASLATAGLRTGSDLAGLKVEDLTKLSVELKFDRGAQRLLEQFLSDKESFMRDDYALAEVSHIRQSFLVTYAECRNEVFFKTVTAPLLRQHSNERLVFNQSRDENDDKKEESEGGEGGGEMEKEIARNNKIKKDGENGIIKTASTSVKTDVEDKEDDDDTSVISTSSTSSGTSLSAEKLSEMSRAFCAALSVGGKGIISYYNLRHLLESHPRRPRGALTAAKVWSKEVQENQNKREKKEGEKEGESKKTQGGKGKKKDETSNTLFSPSTLLSPSPPLELKQFIQRAGCLSSYHLLMNNGEIATLDNLLAIDADTVPKKKIFFQKTCKMDAVSALRLAEITAQQLSGTGNLNNFDLPSRRRVMEVFEQFYTVGAQAFPEGTSSFQKKVEEVEEDVEEGEKKEGENDVKTEEKKDAEITPTPLSTPPPPPTYTPHQLEQWAYTFSGIVCDSKGRAVISVLEIIDHLFRHPVNPEEAIATAVSEAVNPPLPKPPVVEPSPPPARVWIDEWLDAAGSVGGVPLAKYADMFKGQGFVQRSDLQQGSPLTLDELEKVLGINVLAHRRKLVELHTKLLQEPPTPPTAVSTTAVSTTAVSSEVAAEGEKK